MPQSDRLARSLVDSSKAFEAGEMVKTVLDRAIKAISNSSDHAKLHGRLSPDEQYAVRVLRSRQRLIDREWLAEFGVSIAKIRARIELSVAKPDDGTLFRLGEKMHAQGRLSCQACATIMEPDMVVPVPASRLCNHCQRGIEHVYDVQELVPTDDRGIHLAGSVPATVPEGGQPPMKARFTRHFYCDNCNRSEVVVL